MGMDDNNKCELVIWGAGKFYHRLKSEIMHLNIKYIVDNNPSLQGTRIDGIEIISAEKLNNVAFSYVVIFVKDNQMVRQITKQLLEKGIPKDKICTYKRLSEIVGFYPVVHKKRGTVTLDEWFEKHRHNKKFLLISHEFSYTGVPVAMLNISTVLKEMGYSVILTAAYQMEGDFAEELCEQEIDYIKNLAFYSESDWFAKKVRGFDCIVAGCITQVDFVQKLSELDVKILWWIHETSPINYKQELPSFNKNVHIYGGGNRVVKIFKSYYKDAEIQKLQYCIPCTNNIDITARNIITFGVIGTFSYRKAQDLVFRAIIGMPQQYRSTFRCFMIGKLNNKSDELNKYKEIIQKTPEVRLIGEMGQSELDHMYEEIDVLICPSRDDPMPIVVTQAMMHGKFCIISENVGQAEFICQGENGFVFANENIEELQKYMIWVLEHKGSIGNAGKRSREIYEKEFSPDAMKRNLMKIMDEMNV